VEDPSGTTPVTGQDATDERLGGRCGRTRPDAFYFQSAVIPYRRLLSRRLQVCLITNRRRTRWIVPKGVVEPDLSPAESAAKEAWEEAGLRGHVQEPEIGRYRYHKWGGECEVSVYPMRVTRTLRDWPEKDRQRRWLPLQEALVLIEQARLRALLQRLPEMLERAGG
jgi:phosphohistidine phosphatase